MRINQGERHNYYEMKHQQDERRKKIVEAYKFHLPLIERYIYYPILMDHRFKVITEISKDEVVNQGIKKLFTTIIDIRNNLDAFNPDSNCIFKSDNKFSNETKELVRTLLGKGWNYTEIVYEVERIYGHGVLASLEYIDPPFMHERIISTMTSLSLFLGGSYLMFKFIRKIKKI